MADLQETFTQILKLIDQYNGIGKWKRFYPIAQQNRREKYTTVGFHDYLTKKHIISDLRSYDAKERLDEMRAILKKEISNLRKNLDQEYKAEQAAYNEDQELQAKNGYEKESLEEWRERKKDEEIMSIMRSKNAA